MTDTDRRTEFVAGLRDLLAFYEAHPDFPAPYQPNLGVNLGGSPDTFSGLVRQLGADRDIKRSDTLIQVIRRFGPVELELYVSRGLVCTRRVVGTEKVRVSDPSAPMVEVDREVVEWDCAPVLASADRAGADLAWHPDEEPFTAEAVDDAIDARTEDRHERQATQS